jgi:hypothetical protein
MKVSILGMVCLVLMACGEIEPDETISRTRLTLGTDGSGSGEPEDEIGAGAVGPVGEEMSATEQPKQAPAEALPGSVQQIAPSPLQLTWPDASPERDQRLSATSALALRVLSLFPEPVTIRLERLVTADGHEHLDSLGESRIEPNTATTISIPLPDVGDLDFSAQLDVGASILRDESPVGASSADSLFFHRDGSNYVVYEENGLEHRHKAGDLKDAIYSRTLAERGAASRRITRPRTTVTPLDEMPSDGPEKESP